MCCTLDPADLSNTILYATQTVVSGKLVHVLGYQNRAENRSRGPNAMILPFPASEPMGPANVLDTSGCRHFMEDYAEAMAPDARGISKSFEYSMDETLDACQVFDSGNYTVVLATNANAIPKALNQVPANKRPRLNNEIFAAYAKWYPGWPIALCCFDGSVESEPMLWWYAPQDEKTLFLPGLDAHDGHPPVLGQKVSVDHTLVYGSSKGVDVSFQDRIDPSLKPYVTKHVVGKVLQDSMINGDFTVSVDQIHSRQPWPRVSRVQPPGAL